MLIQKSIFWFMCSPNFNVLIHVYPECFNSLVHVYPEYIHIVTIILMDRWILIHTSSDPPWPWLLGHSDCQQALYRAVASSAARNLMVYHQSGYRVWLWSRTNPVLPNPGNHGFYREIISNRPWFRSVNYYNLQYPDRFPFEYVFFFQGVADFPWRRAIFKV